MKIYQKRTTGKEFTISFPDTEHEFYFREEDKDGRVIYTPVGLQENK